MKLLDLEIFTKRLLLQPISLKYKEDIFREFTETITTYMHPHPPQVISETELFIHESLREMHNGDNLIVVIVKKDKDEDKFLGCAGIHKLKSICPELGIWLKESAHGNGYGLEAINALKGWAESNLDYEYLIYPVDRANISSRRIPERLGGQIFREYKQTNLSGKVLHLLEYRISKQ